MPRTILEPRFQVEYLSILDSDGKLDASLEPDIPAADLKRLYRGMLLGRRLDERMIRLQRQGRIGTFAPDQGPGGLAGRRRLDAEAERLDGAVVPRDRRHAVARVADREAADALRRLPRGRPAGARAERPADHDPGRHPAPARRRPRLRGPVPRRRRGGHGVLRRRRHVGGRLPRGAELRRRLARAGGLRRPEQPVGDLGAAQEADALADHRAEGAGLRAARPAGGRQRRPRRLRGVPRGGRAGARRRRADADRVRDLPTRRAHDGRRPDQVPLDRGGRGVGAQGPAHALRHLSAEEEAPGGRADGVGRRRDRRGGAALRGRSAPPDPLTMFEHAYGERPPHLDAPARRAGRAAAERRRRGPPRPTPRIRPRPRCAASARAAGDAWPS